MASSAPAETVAALERRIARLERVLIGSAVSSAGGNHRYPKCWHDAPVRAAVIERHRAMTIEQAVAEITAEFGGERAPSSSALHRIWQRLDRVSLAHKDALMSD